MKTREYRDASGDSWYVVDGYGWTMQVRVYNGSVGPACFFYA